MADLFRLERSQGWQDISQAVPRLREHLPPQEEPLRRAFESWLQGVVFPKLDINPAEVQERLTLEEIETMLAERIDQWNQELSQKARQEGILEGRQEGEARALLRLLERRFGSLNSEVQNRISAADPDLLLDWIDRAATAANLSEVFTEGPAA